MSQNYGHFRAVGLGSVEVGKLASFQANFGKNLMVTHSRNVIDYNIHLISLNWEKSQNHLRKI